MTSKRKGLGRGLDALIQESPLTSPSTAPSSNDITKIPIADIRHNPWQPRQRIAADALDELTHSVREKGVLQPLLVRSTPDGYELIAGERRLTAARNAQLREVPVVIMNVSDREALELALIENLQREDLNIIEEADGYLALRDKFKLTQEQIAQCVGKGRATVANAMRVLNLPEEIKTHLSAGTLTPGHAKVLLGLEIPEEQKMLAQRILKEGLSVRHLERIVAKAHKPRKKPRAERTDIPETHLRHLEDSLHHHFGTSVRLSPSKTLSNGKKVRGRLEIDFYSSDELDRLLSIFGVEIES